jgi:predicted nucleotidyltransferase
MDALAHARFGKPLLRKRAKALIDKAVEAATLLNALPPDAPYYWVTRLAVFGSYLDVDKRELGDLDLAWEVQERPGVSGHALKSIMYNRDGLQSTRAQVSPKSPFVRLVNFGDLLELQCPYQEIYSFDSEELIKARSQKAAEYEEYRKSLGVFFRRHQ